MSECHFITDAKTALDDIILAMVLATKFITISSWILTKNKVTDIIFELLRSKATSGVKVTILHFSNIDIEILRQSDLDQYLFLIEGDKINLSEFKNLINHSPAQAYINQEKIIVTDDTVIFSDRNFSEEYYSVFGPAKIKGIDLHIKNSNIAVAINKHIESGLSFNCNYHDDGFNFFAKCHSKKLDFITPEIIRQIEKASKIVIVNYSFDPNDEIKKELKNASDRGVEIEVVTNKSGLGPKGLNYKAAKDALRYITDDSKEKASLFIYDDSIDIIGHNYFVFDNEECFHGGYNYDFCDREMDTEYLVNIRGSAEAFIEYTENLKKKCQVVNNFSENKSCCG